MIVVVIAAVFSVDQARAGFLDNFSNLTGITTNDAKLSSDNYQPNAGIGIGKYKGEAIHLKSFTNRAENTKQWSYPSSDGRMWYRVQHGSIDAYFWYCFQKYLRLLEMIVYENQATAEVVQFNLTLQYLTDKSAKFELFAVKGKEQLLKSFSVSFDPPATENRNALEHAQYRMMDKIILSILTDPEFKKLFFE